MANCTIRKKKAFPNSTFTVRRGKMKTFFYLNNCILTMHSTLCPPTRPPSPKYGISYYFKWSRENVVLPGAIGKYSLCKVVVVFFFLGGGGGGGKQTVFDGGFKI